MWAMLTAKVPTKPSPPKMSIHWAIPWPNAKYAKAQFDHVTGRAARKKKYNPPKVNYSDRSLEFLSGTRTYCSKLFGGFEPHWAGARKILYKDKHIRIFPHEFSLLSAESMKSYIEESHTFVADTAAQRKIKFDITDGELRSIYDAALLDGANEEQAVLMALGVDVSDESLYPEPIGWYQIKPEYGNVFCYAEELEV